jgi:hypothetical protein
MESLFAISSSSRTDNLDVDFMFPANLRYFFFFFFFFFFPILLFPSLFVTSRHAQFDGGNGEGGGG